MKKSVKNLFIEKQEDQGAFLLNEDLALDFENKQEAAQYLVDAIRSWKGKRSFFCSDNTANLPEDEWSFGYKTPSTCAGCVSGQRILDKIFNGRENFNALPFVIYGGDRQYSFVFGLLKHFAKNGHESTISLMKEQDQEKARKKMEAGAEEQRQADKKREARLLERFSKEEISKELQKQILPYADNKSLIIVSSDIALVLTSRSEWGSSGGIGYYDQVRAFYKDQAQMKEWQWRDRYSASNDRPQVKVEGFGRVKILEKEKEISVEVELINKEYGNRSATYNFKLKVSSPTVSISKDEQAVFIAQAEKEIARIMSNLNRLWECKPKMLSSIPMTDGYISYSQPKIKQKELRPEIGILAFVTEEQIDHRVSDPQIRHELYVLIIGNEKAEPKVKDHGYYSEGGAFLSILEVKMEGIVINTKDGKKLISL